MPIIHQVKYLVNNSSSGASYCFLRTKKLYLVFSKKTKRFLRIYERLFQKGSYYDIVIELQKQNRCI